VPLMSSKLDRGSCQRQSPAMGLPWLQDDSFQQAGKSGIIATALVCLIDDDQVKDAEPESNCTLKPVSELSVSLVPLGIQSTRPRGVLRQFGGQRPSATS